MGYYEPSMPQQLFRYTEVGFEFGTGDEVTISADLDKDMVSFRKNGAVNVTPQEIPNEPYYFAVKAQKNGTTVTIVRTD